MLFLFLIYEFLVFILAFSCFWCQSLRVISVVLFLFFFWFFCFAFFFWLVRGLFCRRCPSFVVFCIFRVVFTFHLLFFADWCCRIAHLSHVTQSPFFHTFPCHFVSHTTAGRTRVLARLAGLSALVLYFFGLSVISTVASVPGRFQFFDAWRPIPSGFVPASLLLFFNLTPRPPVGPAPFGVLFRHISNVPSSGYRRDIPLALSFLHCCSFLSHSSSLPVMITSRAVDRHRPNLFHFAPRC